MIKWVTGRPGGGKGLRAMQVLGDALRGGKYTRIVTNLPLKLPELQIWCDEHKLDVELDELVVVLRPEVLGCRPSKWKDICRNFFLYRLPKGEKVPDPEEGEELDFPKDSYGILWIIDEIHKFWPSSESMSIKKWCPWLLEYLAEHRHFGDDVVFVTQAPGQVTAQVRITAQDFEVVRNWGKEKHSHWAGPKKFQVKCFLSVPTPSTQSIEDRSFTLASMDGLQDCYNTSTRGGDADKGQTAKGMPWWTIYAAFAAIFVICVTAAIKGPSLIISRTGFDKTAFAETPKPSVSSSKKSFSDLVTDAILPVKTQDSSISPSTITGVYQLNGIWYVCFDDPSGVFSGWHSFAREQIRLHRGVGLSFDGGPVVPFNRPSTFDSL